MFTGLVETTGTVVSVSKRSNGARIAIDAKAFERSLSDGDSVSVNGACQTVVSVSGSVFEVDAVGDTMTKTTLGSFESGRIINLERARKISERLDGHIVLGHVNGVGRVVRWEQAGEGWSLGIECPEHLMRYLAAEGSVAIDGISLTVAERNDSSIRISVIPHTRGETNLSGFSVGIKVNIEVDILAKYVEGLLAHGPKTEAARMLDERTLQSWGY